MKKLMGILFLVLFCWSFLSLAQSTPPVASPVGAVITTTVAAPTGFAAVIAFVKANWKQIASCLYIVVDTVIYFVPSLAANGLWQQIEIWLGKQSSVVKT